MMNADQNMDRHAMHQMWIETRGRLPTYTLVEGLGPNVVHACNFFFFFLNEYKTCLLRSRKYGDSSRVF